MSDAAVKTTPPRSERHCKVAGCKRPYKAKGYCNVHYKQWRRGKLPKPRWDKAKKLARAKES